MEILANDVRYAFRIMRNNFGFTLIIILTLALGIGANTSIFSIVNAVLLRSLPYYDPNRLVKITFNNPGIGLSDLPFSVPEWEDLKSRAGVFEEVGIVWPTSANLIGGKDPERLEALGVSPNYFSILGGSAQIGRLFGPQDFALGFAEAAVISDSLWRRSYGGDPNILGKHLRLDNDPYEIVGVLPAGFRHPGKTIAKDVEVWVTTGFSADPFPKPARNVRLLPGAIGRLKPGISIGQAQEALRAMAGELRTDFPNDYPPEAKWSIEIEPLQKGTALVERRCVPQLAELIFNVRGSPGRANRVRQCRKPSIGTRLGKTKGNVTSDGAWGRPCAHGAPDVDGVAGAVPYLRFSRRARCEIDLGLHHSFRSHFSSSACRSGCRPDCVVFCASDFHLHWNHIWARSSFSRP